MQEVVTANQRVQLEALTADTFLSLGLVQLNGYLVKPSCELYRLYFRS
ncbi:AAA-like domain-containing protein [Scytonema sp. NUACC26]